MQYSFDLVFRLGSNLSQKAIEELEQVNIVLPSNTVGASITQLNKKSHHNLLFSIPQLNFGLRFQTVEDAKTVLRNCVLFNLAASLSTCVVIIVFRQNKNEHVLRVSLFTDNEYTVKLLEEKSKQLS